MKPPVRMLDDASLPPELRADLDVAARAFCPYDVDQGLTALEAALKLDPLQPGEAPDSAREQALEPMQGAASGASVSPEYLALSQAKWLPWVLKAALAALGGACIVSLAMLGRSHSSSRSAHSVWQPPAVEARLEAPQWRATDVQEAATDPRPEVREQAPDKGPSQSRSAARRELMQLERIKELFARDPETAYRLARASQQEFPHGTLREEREGLTVLVLWRLERRSAARAEARTFLARYPESPLRERVQRVFGDAGLETP
jgi:hypothetical protein